MCLVWVVCAQDVPWKLSQALLCLDLIILAAENATLTQSHTSRTAAVQSRCMTGAGILTVGSTYLQPYGFEARTATVD